MHAPQMPGVGLPQGDPWAILEALRDACTLLDANGAALYANAASQQLSGTQAGCPDVLAQQSTALALSDDDIAALRGALHTVLRGEQAQAELEHRYQTGEQQGWLSATITAYSYGSERGALVQQQDITARKQAEAAQHETEARFRFLSEATFEGLVIHEQGRITDANRALATMYGYRHDEMIGLTVLDLATPDQHELIRNNVRIGHDKPYETVGLRKDGSTFPIEVHSKPTRHQGRELRVASVRDITDRKRAEEAMERAQAFLNSVIENIPLMLIVKDAQELRFVRFNKAGEELLGLTRDELIGKNDYDFFPTHEADFFTGKDREVLTGRTVIDIPEEPIQTHHQGQRILHTRKIPILNEQGQPEYLLAIAEDITERKQAEAALQASERRYQKMLANMPGMVYQFALAADGSSSFPLVSDGVRDVLGLEPAQLQANPGLLLSTLDQNDQAGFNHAFYESAATLQPLQWEGRLTRSADEQRWVQTIARPEQQADGTILWDGLMLDITERKRAAETLRLSEMQAETIRTQAAVLAEISTPVFPLSANTMLMPLIGAIDSGRARQMIEALLEGVQTHQAQIVIVDITGVPVVDTQVANVLIQAARAVRLLGAQIVLTGIRPEIAQTLVGLGIDLSGLTTRGSLQSGVAYALAAG